MLMSETVEKRKPIFYFHVVVFLFFLIGFGQLPPIYPLEKLGMQVLGIFIGLLYGWTFIDFVVTSLIGTLALALIGFTSMNNVFALGFGNNIFVLVFFMFIWSIYLNDCGFSKYLAEWFVSRKICVGHPWIFTTMLFLSALVLGACISLVATIVIVWNIFYQICDLVGFQKKDKYTAYGLVGMAFAAMVGYNIFPYKVVAALALQNYTAFSGLEVGFTTFVLCSGAIAIASILLYVLVGKLIIKPDVSLLQSEHDYFAEQRNRKMTKEAKIGGISVIALLVMCILPEYLVCPLTQPLKILGINGSIALIIAVLIFVHIDGKPILNFTKCMTSPDFNWTLLFLFMSTMPLANALSSSETGVIAMIGYYGETLFGNMSPLLFVIAFALFGAIATQFAHNLVLAAVLTPIMCAFLGTMHVDAATSTMCVIVFAFGLGIALATPGASTPGALIYANTEWITRGQSYGYSIIAVICGIIAMLVVGIPICLLLC